MSPSAVPGAAPDPPEAGHVQGKNIVPGGVVHEPALQPLPLEQAAVETGALIDDNFIGPREEEITMIKRI